MFPLEDRRVRYKHAPSCHRARPSSWRRARDRAPRGSNRQPARRPRRRAPAIPAGSQGALGTVRLALDWTPNTNHTGFYVADANGWYDQAGVDLQVLPYTGTTPETLIAAGQAECGISFQDAMTFAAAAGAPIVSVMAILQHTAQEIAVLASSDHPAEGPRRPHYAGFGYPNEEPTLQSVIKADGGTAPSRSSPSTPPRTTRSTPSAPTS